MDLNFIGFLHPSLWIKIITIIVLVFYVIFTFIVFTQVKMMAQILTLPRAQGLLRLISIIHIVLAVSLFVLAVVIL